MVRAVWYKTNKWTNKTDTVNSTKVTGGKGVKYMVTEGDWTLSNEHTMQYTSNVLQDSILET